MYKLNSETISNLVRVALAEDIGSGDATSLAVVPESAEISAHLVSRETCICAGLEIGQAVFRELDSECGFEPRVEDGAQCAPNTVLAVITGRGQALLGAERTALNFMQRMSGIATMTRRFVNATGQNSITRILDTRKTTPGLRVLEKYAVAAGGGTNHRFGLYDRILIKDNHLAIAAIEGPGGINRAVKASREKFPQLEIEVEVDTIEQAEEAMAAKVEYILLDNMSDDEISAVVSSNSSQSLIEVSGNITLDRVSYLSSIGVDFISIGGLTHSAPAVDLALDLNLE